METKSNFTIGSLLKQDSSNTRVAEKLKYSENQKLNTRLRHNVNVSNSMQKGKESPLIAKGRKTEERMQ